MTDINTHEKSEEVRRLPPHTELLEKMLTRIEAYCSGLVTSLLDSTDKRLLQDFNAARSLSERNHLQEFMHILRRQRNAFEKRYLMELNQYFKPVAVCKELPRKKKAEADTFDGLSLVSQDEMDEMVAVTSISSKAAANFSDELAQLEIRLQYLATLNPNVFHEKALEPHNLCDAFRETLGFSDFTATDKLMLIKAFGDELMKSGKAFYREMNTMMIDDGLMPRIDYQAKIVRREGQGSGYSHASAQQYSHDQMRGPLGRGGQAGGYYSAAPREVPTGGPASLSPAEAARISAGMPVGRIVQGIQSFVGAQPALSDSAGVEIDPALFYSRQDVVSALSNLQAAVELMHDVPLQFDADAIKKAVLTTIGQKDGGAVSKRVNQISEKTVDFIKLIFDAIIEDKSITDTIKALLLSMQIPIIKAAMLDADFFVDDKHAARQLLDKIAEAGVGVSEHKDPVYIELRSIVKKLLEDYVEDIAAFSNALASVSALAQRIYDEAQEREKKTQQEVKHAHARNIVLQEIRKITLGKELPHNIRLLVLKIWPSMMFNHYLRFGKANDEWVEMLMILSKVIESVQSSHTLDELAELGLSHEDIIKSVSEKLKKCRKPAEVISQTMADLRAAYDQLPRTQVAAPKESEPETITSAEQVAEVKAADEAQEEVVETARQTAEEETLPPISSDMMESTSQAASPVAKDVSGQEEPAGTEAQVQEKQISPEEVSRLKLEMLPSDVVPGTWFIVFNGEGRPVRRLKLAVILMQDATLVFVDHLGNVVIEKDAEEFSHELERGQSSVIMQHSVFDHALRSALSSIER